jgi:hypothetical protein
MQAAEQARTHCHAHRMQAHLTALGPERVSSVRVRVPPSRMMPTRAALAALAAEWLSDPSAPELPPGNGGPDAALWGGARDAGLLDAASREEHEGRKLRLQKAMVGGTVVVVVVQWWWWWYSGGGGGGTVVVGGAESK